MELWKRPFFHHVHDFAAPPGRTQCGGDWGHFGMPECGLMVAIRPPQGFTPPQADTTQPQQLDTTPKKGQLPSPGMQKRPTTPAADASKPRNDSAAAKPGKEPLGQPTIAAAAFCPMPDEIPAPPIVRLGGWLGVLTHPMLRWLTLAAAPLVGLGIVAGIWEIGLGRRGEPPAAHSPAAHGRRRGRTTAGPKRNKTCPGFSAGAIGSPLAARSHGLDSEPPRRLPGPAARKRRDPRGRRSDVACVHRGALDALGLTLDRVQRVTWAAADPDAWPAQSVVVIELAPGQDAAALANLGKPIDVGMSGLVCRQLSNHAGASHGDRRSADDCHGRRSGAAEPG